MLKPLNSRNAIIVAVGALVAVLAVPGLSRYSASIVGDAVVPPGGNKAPAQARAEKTSAPRIESPQPAPVAVEDSAAETEEDLDIPEPVNYYNGRDPETQPRGFLVQGLVGVDPWAAGYAVTGDDFAVSNEGWTLAPLPAGEDPRPRAVMIESPIFALNFPVNAVTPMWKSVRRPEGTEVLVEVAMSPDGVHWTSWYPTTERHIDGNISPTLSDGRPNPNYGFTQGDTMFFGLGLYYYFKYSMVLYSEVAHAPIVSDFRLFYQDSTMGEGYLAEYNDGRPDEEWEGPAGADAARI